MLKINLDVTNDTCVRCTNMCLIIRNVEGEAITSFMKRILGAFDGQSVCYMNSILKHVHMFAYEVVYRWAKETLRFTDEFLV